ncbi:hypothetical protein [Longibaculum muris]|uniref:hypothetical protein n=1 Tax=Longibaculum muris TaxID=1796628 RepID=UPI00189F6A98|nr:hypothetical protein [Longibaculum muris]
MKERHLLRNTFLIGLAIVTILCVIIMDIYIYCSKYEGYNIYYNGAIMPLQIDHPQDITATRNTEINISNNFLIKEEYELYNHSQQEKTIQLKYPYLGYLSNKDEFMIEANGKSIDYQINLQQFINQYQYSKENQLFERTLPHNINQIKQLLDNQPKKLSQQMKDLLKQEVYVYRFVDRQYPQDGTVCYLTVDIPKNQKIYCYNIDKNEDEIFEIMMDNGEYALTPMLISKEKIKDIHLTGYSDSNLNKVSHEVKAKIDEEKITVKKAIDAILLEQNNIFLKEKQYQINQDSINQNFYHLIDEMIENNVPIEMFSIEYIIDDAYYQISHEVKIPADSSIKLNYQYLQNYYVALKSKQDHNFNYMTQYQSSLNITSQKIKLILQEPYSLKDDNLGLKKDLKVYQKDIDLNQDEYYIDIDVQN